MNTSLKEINRIFGLSAENGINVSVTGVSIDSRTIKPESLFVAIKGENHDGHQWVRQAFDNGASAAVVRAGFDASEIPFKNRLIYVDDTLLALQLLAQEHRRHFHMPVIAITGSNGKTTTKEMISAVLSKKMQVVKTPGNLNNHIGLALSLCNWPVKADVGVLEMGTNHFGEIRRLCEIARPTHGVITNIGKGHLEFFHDLAGVAKAKSELLESLKDHGQAFLNGDDPLLIARKDIVSKTITYGFSNDCDIRGERLDMDESGCPAMIVEGVKIRVPLPGSHNLLNALAAAAVGRAFDLAWQDIKSAIESFKAVQGRMDVFQFNGVTVINDAYNANPSSLIKMIDLLGSIPAKGRKIAVLGDMLELGDTSQKEHIIIGQQLSEKAIDAFFAYGGQMYYAVSEAEKTGSVYAAHYKNKDDLHKDIIRYIEPGDIVLLKGSRGMKMEEFIEALKKFYRPGKGE